MLSRPSQRQGGSAKFRDLTVSDRLIPAESEALAPPESRTVCFCIPAFLLLASSSSIPTRQQQKPDGNSHKLSLKQPGMPQRCRFRRCESGTSDAWTASEALISATVANSSGAPIGHCPCIPAFLELRLSYPNKETILPASTEDPYSKP